MKPTTSNASYVQQPIAENNGIFFSTFNLLVLIPFFFLNCICSALNTIAKHLAKLDAKASSTLKYVVSQTQNSSEMVNIFPLQDETELASLEEKLISDSDFWSRAVS